MRKRNLILALLLLAFIGTGSTFAWWFSGLDNGVADSENTVTIGESNAKTSTTLTLGDPDNDSVTLVPFGEAVNSVNPSTVEEYKVYQFAVKWAEVGATSMGKLSVELGDVEFMGFDGTTDLKHLLLVYFSTTLPAIEAVEDFDNYLLSLSNIDIELNDEDAITIYVIVRLDQPADQDEYDLVVDQEATFEIDFLVTPVV